MCACCNLYQAFSPLPHKWKGLGTRLLALVDCSCLSMEQSFLVGSKKEYMLAVNCFVSSSPQPCTQVYGRIRSYQKGSTCTDALTYIQGLNVDVLYVDGWGSCEVVTSTHLDPSIGIQENMQCLFILVVHYSRSSVIQTSIIRALAYPNWVSSTIIIFIINRSQ